jgi:two-component system OmpR family response regulator/two-component system response regulator QseB
MRVLLVEDDRMIGDALRLALRHEGWAVDWVRDGEAARQTLATEAFELVLLDLGLPGLDGLAVLRDLRARHDRTPVIVLTARDALADRVAGLDSGADDYVVKPVEVEELSARMRAVLRRHTGRAEPALSCGDVTLDPATKQVMCKGEPVLLSAREYALLEALMLRPGAILSRAQLEDRLYGWGDAVESNAISVYIHQLRRKLGPDFIRNIRGVGYFVGQPGGGGA